jgi:tetratricopeptide (TPR) repeat protein
MKHEAVMNRRIRFFKFVASSFVLASYLVSCTSLNSSLHNTAAQIGKKLNIVDDASVRPPPEAPDRYRTAVSLLNEEKFEQALNALDTFLQADPTSSWTQAATLNSGRALEGLARWTEASDRYRAVVASTKDAPKLQAMALYRLSFCYEALGDEQSVVATLHDLLSRAKFLPSEVSGAELPARLAGAYARVGNFDEAVDYYKRAESGILRLRKESHQTGGKDLPEWLPRTLYYMGSMALQQLSWDNFETALRPLARSQVYLLEAAELGVEPWSLRAAKDLMGTYNELWKAIEDAPVQASDPLYTLRATQEKQWDRAILLLDSVGELKARELPGALFKTDLGEQARQIATFLTELDHRAQKLLAERPIGEGLTRESIERREGIRGQVVAPDDSLERRFLRDAKTYKPTSLPPKGGDPNL